MTRQIGVVILAAALMLTACSGGAVEPDGGADAPRARAGSEAELLYARNCASCHGEDLEGGIGPSLVAANFKLGFETAFDLLRYVSTQMPQNAPGSLSDDAYRQILEVILTVRGVAFAAPLIESDTLAINVAEDATVVATIPPPPRRVGTAGPAAPTAPAAPGPATATTETLHILEPSPGPSGTVDPYGLRFEIEPGARGANLAAVEYEIRDAESNSVVWRAQVETARGRADLWSGSFEGSLAGRMGLAMGHSYRVYARTLDAGGAGATDWIASDAVVVAAPASGERPAPYPLRVAAIRPESLTWTTYDGRPVDLPAGATAAPWVDIVTPAGRLARIAGTASPGNALQLSSANDRVASLLIQVHAGDAASLPIPDSTLHFVDDIGRARAANLPGLALGSGQSVTFSVGANGATFWETDDLIARGAEPSLSSVARHAADPWLTRPGFAVERVASGFQFPVNLAFRSTAAANDDGVVAYITELFGRVLALNRDGTWAVFADGLLNFDPVEAPQSLGGQSGVSGVVVDDSTGDVLVSRVVLDGSSLYNQIARIRASSDGRRAESVDPVLDLRPDPTVPSHQIHELTIGPDGKLYANVGNAFSGAQSQSTDTFNGKILRLNLDGSAPADNPLYRPAAPDAPASYVFAWGIRNAFGADWRRRDQTLYIAENGDDLDRVVAVTAGANLGYDGTDASLVRDALIVFGPPAVAPTGIAVQNGTELGADRTGRMYVAEGGQSFRRGPQAAGKRIWELAIAPDGTLAGPPIEFAVYVGAGRASLSGMAFGPDGLYFLDLFPEYPTGGDAMAADANLWRIVVQAG